MKIIIGVTGASGVVYSRKLLEVLGGLNFETHLIISKAGGLVIERELKMSINKFKKLANFTYENEDLMASISSGSYLVDAMVIVPASMKTIGSICAGISDNLITRAADVQLKEKRKLILVPRETPLNAIHLENLAKLSKLGVIILPAMPGFYNDPESIENMVDFIVGKILDQLNINHSLYKRWS